MSEDVKKETEEVVTTETEVNEVKTKSAKADKNTATDEDLKKVELNEHDGEESDISQDKEEEEMREEFQQEVEAMMARLFSKRRVHMASADEQRELYKDGKDTMLDKTGKALTDKQLKKKAIIHLLQAARSIPAPMILTGVVRRVQKLDNDRLWLIVEEIDPNTGKTAHEIPIKIPVSQFFEYDKTNYEGEKGKEYLHRECISRINSVARFIVYDVDEKNGFAVGSRLAALERDGIANYYKKMGDGVPRVINDMIVPARVVGVRKDRVRLEVRGADVTLSNRDLSWTALGVLTDEFHTGDSFMVKVSNIEFKSYEVDGRKYNLVHIKASRKDAMENPAIKYYDTFNLEDVVSGVIKSEANEKGVFVNLEGKMDALCANPVHGIPAKGAQCVVLITKKDDEQKRIYGTIIDMN